MERMSSGMTCLALGFSSFALSLSGLVVQRMGASGHRGMCLIMFSFSLAVLIYPPPPPREGWSNGGWTGRID